jgi:ketosteroid isomerase-like protein
MEWNIPEIVAEVTSAHERYEAALVSDDVETLVRFFLSDPSVVRFGPTENLHGHEAIASFRRRQSRGGVAQRHLLRRVVMTFGRDFASTAVEFQDSGRSGRQTQTWVRTADGWKISCAHVSFLGI